MFTNEPSVWTPEIVPVMEMSQQKIKSLNTNKNVKRYDLKNNKSALDKSQINEDFTTTQIDYNEVSFFYVIKSFKNYKKLVFIVSKFLLRLYIKNLIYSFLNKDSKKDD